MKAKLTPIQRYLLTCLMEECAEVSKEAAKCIRFGPEDDYDGVPPKARLAHELDDLDAVIIMLAKEKLEINPSWANAKAKITKLKKMIKYSKKKGLL